MERDRARLARFLAPATLALIAACAAGDPSIAQPASTPSVEALIGNAACDSDAQCRTIAVGAKACGGPSRYVAWSSLRTDAATLQRAADRETQAARLQVEKSGVMSNCAVVADPGAVCTAAAGPAGAERRCQLRPAGSGGPSKIY